MIYPGPEGVLALDDEILRQTQQTEACILSRHVMAQVKVLANDFPYLAMAPVSRFGSLDTCFAVTQISSL